MSFKGIGKAAVRVSAYIKSARNGDNCSMLIILLKRLRKHSNRSSTLCVLEHSFIETCWREEKSRLISFTLIGRYYERCCVHRRRTTLSGA